MIPEITVTPANYGWMATGGVSTTLGLPVSGLPPIPAGRNCGRCRRNAYRQAEYQRLFARLRDSDERTKAAVREAARSAFRLKTAPRIRMTLGVETYII